MRTRINNLSDKSVRLGLFFLTFVFFGFFALFLNIPPVIDEVTQMANTAWMVGYDWTESVFAMGNYYFKPASSILYYPFFLIFKDSFALYKSIMVLNMATISLIPCFAYTILKKHLKVTDKLTAGAIALTIGTLPSAVLYSMYARADVCLILLPWPLMLTCLEAFEAKGPERTRLSILAGFLATFGYMCHTRGLVLIIALFLTMLLVWLITKRKPLNFIAAALSTVFFILTDILLCAVFKSAVYIASTEHSSVESFDFAYLKNLFSWTGIKSMLKLLLGWTYNILVSTYGLVLVGGLVALYILVRAVKKQKAARVAEKLAASSQRAGDTTPASGTTAGVSEAGAKTETDKCLFFSVFSLLNLLGAIGMGALFFFKYADWYYKGLYVMRADRFIYGRYTVCAVGGLMLLGLYALIVKRDLAKLKTKLAAGAAFAAVTGVFLWKAAPYLANGQACTRYFISLCTFLELPNPGATVATYPDIVKALGLAAALGFTVYLAFVIWSSFCGRQSKGPRGLAFDACDLVQNDTNLCKGARSIALLLLTSIVIFSVNYYKLRLGRDENLMARVWAPAMQLEACRDVAEEFPEVLVLQNATDIKHYQAVCKEFRCGDVSTEAAKASNCFIVARKGGFLRQYYDGDYYTFDDYDYENLRDIVYVKGEKLKNRLEKLGMTLTAYGGKLKDTVDEKIITVTPDNTK